MHVLAQALVQLLYIGWHELIVVEFRHRAHTVLSREVRTYTKSETDSQTY